MDQSNTNKDGLVKKLIYPSIAILFMALSITLIIFTSMFLINIINTILQTNNTPPTLNKLDLTDFQSVTHKLGI